MKRARLWFCLFATIIAAYLFLNVGIGVVAVESALHPARRSLAVGETLRAEADAGRYHANLTDVSIHAEDGSILRAWSIRPAVWNGDTVILLHGQADNRAGMLGNVDLLLGNGYAVLVPDARAHGASEGLVATYGIKESGDIRHWSDWIRKTEAPHCIDGLGESMGAAQLLESLKARPGFCAVVAECSFANFKEASFDRLGEQFHAGPWFGRIILRPAFMSGLVYAQWKYGIDLAQASPESAVRDSDVPVLLIHRLRDSNLPPRHSEMILALNDKRNPKVVLWEPAMANHCGAAAAEPGEYERRVVGWFIDHESAANRKSP